LPDEWFAFVSGEYAVSGAHPATVAATVKAMWAGGFVRPDPGIRTWEVVDGRAARVVHYARLKFPFGGEYYSGGAPPGLDDLVRASLGPRVEMKLEDPD
jgi:hypothetical protein